MTLATTCPQCRTSFKVVPDQLKLRRGLVRCGACQHVFSGIDFLTYVEAAERSDLRTPVPGGATESDAPLNTSPQPDQSTVAGTQSDRAHDLSTTILAAAQHRFRQSQSASDLGPVTVVASTEPTQEGSLTDHLESDPGPSGDPQASISESDAEHLDDPIDQDAERFASQTVPLASQALGPIEPSVIESNDEARLADLEHVTLESTSLASSDPTDSAQTTHSAFEPATPEFRSASAPQDHEALGETHLTLPSRSADRRIPWTAALVFAALAALLVAQAGIGWRHEIAARFPAVQPVMSLLGLTIEPPRDRAALSIESFELRTTDAAGRLELSAVLRNRAAYAVALPAMELSLTDGGGAVVVRKVLKATEYAEPAGFSAKALSARSEQPIRLMLELAGPPPSGYSVDIFYP
jgi:predicted Zn finger-like uncharacterized protein